MLLEIVLVICALVYFAYLILAAVPYKPGVQAPGKLPKVSVIIKWQRTEKAGYH